MKVVEEQMYIILGQSKLLKISLLISVLALALAGCTPASSSQAKPITDIKIAMGFIPNVQFAPFYVAQERGYFKDEGLQVTFDYGFDTDLIKLLASDELQFVVGSGEQVILARSQGLPIVYVMQWYRKFPVSVVSLESANIRTPADLVGKRVGTPVMFGASYIGWKAIVQGARLPEDQITLQTIGYTQVASLLEGRVDAAVCYTANEPVQLRTAGHVVREIMASDYVDIVSNGLLTNEKSVNDRSATVAAVVRALTRGIADTIADPKAAFDLTLKHVPEAGGDNRAVQEAVLARSVELWKTDKIGISSRDSWTASQNFMRDAGLIDTATDVDRLFTNRFVESK
jgi:NitT/TauT family transport system substrate-binding protein